MGLLSRIVDKKPYELFEWVIWEIAVAVCSCLPIRRKTILFEGNKAFEDSSRALFLKMIENGLHTNDYIWFVSNPDKYSYLRDYGSVRIMSYVNWRSLFQRPSETLRFILLNCTAEYCIYCNGKLGLRVFNGQHRVYLTHGIALKRIDGICGDVRRLDLIVSPSEFTSQLIDKASPGAIDITRVLGYPRNDLLFEPDPLADDYIDSLNGQKLIMWMPTFKHVFTPEGYKDRNDFADNRNNDVSLITPRSLEEINEKLREKSIVLVIKFHPFQNLGYVNICNYTNIVSITQSDLEKMQIPTYAVMRRCDALITDYSSVAFDYMLLDRPIAYDLSDYDAYANGVGFSVDRPQDFMPGPIIRTVDDLKHFIDDVSNDNDAFGDERRRVCSLMNHYNDNSSSQRVLDYLTSIYTSI